MDRATQQTEMTMTFNGQTNTTLCAGPEDLRLLPTHVLIRRIACQGDRTALDEFHNHRRVFQYKDGPPLLLVDFVATVFATERRVRAFGLPSEVLDRAYDLTVDKFFQLPAGPVPEASPAEGDGAASLKRAGTDCRHYFRIMVQSIDSWQRKHPRPDPLALEAATARIVQQRVAFHCWWSCLEACRGIRRAWSRFCWRRPDGRILVWMPRWLPASRRRAWLEQHLPEVDPRRPDERRRIQEAIDSFFGLGETVPFDDTLHPSTVSRIGSVLDLLVQAEVARQGLAGFVAREKSARIAEQRPAIRRLGRARLQALIRRVFENLEADGEDHAIAEVFGLSRATFSRFAGRRWKTGDHRPIPDLWFNVAAVAGRFALFRELARAAGVLNEIAAIMHSRQHGEPLDGQ
jgi:hypothetical protein